METNRKNSTTFFKRAEFFLARKDARAEDCGRILLGDDTGAGAVMLRPITFRCVAGCIIMWTALYIHAELTTHTYRVPTGAGLPGHAWLHSYIIGPADKRNLKPAVYLCNALSRPNESQIQLFYNCRMRSETSVACLYCYGRR